MTGMNSVLAYWRLNARYMCRPASFEIASGRLVSSGLPVKRSRSAMGCTQSRGYMQDEAKKTILDAFTQCAASNTLSWICKLLERNSAEYVWFSRIPPTLPAAITTT
jgi:hypothetical protein